MKQEANPSCGRRLRIKHTKPSVYRTALGKASLRCPRFHSHCSGCGLRFGEDDTVVGREPGAGRRTAQAQVHSRRLVPVLAKHMSAGIGLHIYHCTAAAQPKRIPSSILQS